MRILGIDPGLAIVGYGVIDFVRGKFSTVAMGAIETPAGIDTEERLNMIYDDLNEVISAYQPDEVAIEELFYHTNQKTVISVAEARGVILLACRKAHIKMAEYTPLQVKQSVVGYGRAEKSQVMEMTRIILGLDGKIPLDDTADALAIAVCHAHCSGSNVQNFYNLKKKKMI
ncbi:MAG: crossover junction endodeoxyribonuclease RuvC [Clostridia bacterium]|nr:crossover junction endodeoxyribonuclease RuvC [Clostridia bacterium]MBO4429624.1 crossover junction endodeoxyribonuclease RuvC [Clostridia bacterium]